MGNCGCGRSSCIIPIIVGIIAGIIAVVVGSVPVLTTFLWIVFGVSLLAIVIFSIVALFSMFIRRGDREENCACKNGVCLLIGGFGALVTSIIALATGLTSTTILFFLAGFFGWLLAAFLLFLICLALANCN